MRIYKTQQGDTWDLIAFRMYPKLGGEKVMDVLLDYNPEYMNIVIFSANIELIIPEIAVPIISKLPLWKRT